MATSYLSLLKAVYDYTATSDDELSIKEDGLYFLLDDSDPDWSKVRAKSDDDDEPSGLVPAAYLEEAPPIASAKALYDYAATGDGELSITEDETLHVYEKDDEWWLVKNPSKPGVGLVPGSYVDETESSGEHAAEATPEEAPAVSHYTDPAELVAQSHAKAKVDTIETWAITEIDAKGKKKKGTLGIGNGNMFFASESDKAPVRRWPTSSVTRADADKPKHVAFQLEDGTLLHFNAGSQATADAIHAKLESSKGASEPSAAPAPRAVPPPFSPPEPAHTPEPTTSQVIKPKKSVNFAPAPPEVITTADSEDEYEETGGDEQDEVGTVLYDFAAEGEDELAVVEGETVTVVDRQGNDDWWKVRNGQGMEGVVPALYVKLANEDETASTPPAASRKPSQDNEAEKKKAELARKEREERERREQQEEADRRAFEDSKRQAAQRELRAEEARRKRLADQQAAEAARAEREASRSKQAERQASPPSMPKRPQSGSGPSNAAPTQFPDKAKVRVWHDRTGQFRVEAQYLGTTSANKLRLHKINGVIIEVPIEKMSPADVTYVEKVNSQDAPRATSQDDDVPLAKLPVVTERPASSPAARAPPPPKRQTIDWFEFFLNAGCDVDDCTRYSSAFERDKIDDTILPDLEASTLRTLGLREGDIIRVMKHIAKRTPQGTPPVSHETQARRSQDVSEQMRKDDELARQLQEREGGSKPIRQTSSPAPNLFAGANGALKNQRRGRPTLEPKSSSSIADLPTIAAASTAIRTSSPQIKSPDQISTPQAPVPAPSPARKPTAGFDDDAWAPRPSSTVGIKSNTPRPNLSTPTPTPPTPPPAPPAPPVASAPIVVAPAPAPALPAVLPPPRPSTAGSGPAPPAASSQFDILAKINHMAQRPPSAPIVSQPTGIQPSPSPSFASPAGYHAGLGVGSAPSPIGQFLTAQRTGALSPPTVQPRGPFAPVPANQSLLAPLVPTNTGFQGFVPTRPSPNQQGTPPGFLNSQPTGFQSQPQLQPQPTGFQLQPQPTGFQPQLTGFQPQPTGFQPQPTGFQSPLQPQATGFQGQNNFGSGGFNSSTGIGFQPNPQVGFQPQQQQFQQGGSVFDNLARSQPPPPPPNDTNPANVFANMKAGGFGQSSSTPQSSDKYDALRNPGGQQSFLAPQQTGWGGQQLQPQGGFLAAQPTGFQPGGFPQNGFQPQPTGFQNGFQQQQQFGNGYR